MSRIKFKLQFSTIVISLLLGYVIFDVLKHFDFFMAGLFLQRPGF